MARKEANKATTAKAAELKLQAFELRKEGKSYNAIAAIIGVSDVTAYRYVTGEIKKLNTVTAEKAEELVRIELERLDLALAAIAPAVKQGDDKAVANWIKISESRRKLLGLDASPAPRSSYMDMFRQMAEDGLITMEQFEKQRQAIAQFEAATMMNLKVSDHENN